MPIGYLSALVAHPLFFPAPDISKTAGARGVFISRSLRVLGCARSFPRRESVSVPHSQTESSVENLCGGRSRSRGITRARREPSESSLQGRGLCGTPLRTVERERYPHSAWQGTVLLPAISLVEQ